MALSDLAVYSEYAYASMTEILMQQVAVFNAASAGCIVLKPATNQGDFSDEAFFAKIAGLVRRRNAYGSGSIAQKTFRHLIDTSVKIAAGTPEIRLDPGQFRWIQRSPEEAGVALGQQLAIDTMADMLNTAIGCCTSALIQVSGVVNDVHAASGGADVPTYINLTNTAAKFGDRQSDLRAWVMHSNSATKLWVNAITNAEHLFNYGSVNVMRDPFGRVFVITDAPSLLWSVTTPSADSGYYTLGLVPGGIYIGQNNDFDAMEQGKTGDENLVRTYQAEWSYNCGILGFSWDKSNGGKSPTDAALFTSTNWDKYSTNNKSLAGVVMKSH